MHNIYFARCPIALFAKYSPKGLEEQANLAEKYSIGLFCSFQLYLPLRFAFSVRVSFLFSCNTKKNAQHKEEEANWAKKYYVGLLYFLQSNSIFFFVNMCFIISVLFYLIMNLFVAAFVCSFVTAFVISLLAKRVVQIGKLEIGTSFASPPCSSYRCLTKSTNC